MRSTLVRTRPVLIDGAGVEALKVDLDGRSPVTLYLENMDQTATQTTRLGDRHANLRFRALTPGTAGNSLAVRIELDNAATSVTVNVSGNNVTIVVPARQGTPYLTAAQVMDAVNADPAFNALLRAELAESSDGTSVLDLYRRTDPVVIQPLTSLSGGFNAAATGAVEVYHSPTPNGPWDKSDPASTALSNIASNATKAFNIVDTPVRGLRVLVSKGAANTYIVATVVG